MKYEALVALFIGVFLLFTGCVGAKRSANSEPDIINTGGFTEEMHQPNLTSEEAVCQEMKTFLQAHPMEMENCAETFLSALEEEKDRTYQYYPDGNILYWYEGGDYHPKGEVEDHPILDAARFLKDTEVFDLIVASDRFAFADGSYCCFSKYVKSNNEYLCRVNLIYTRSAVSEKEYFPLEKIEEQWYLYIEYLE